MAIKVKHDGNITSRIYASAAGGKGKRQAEDAKLLASLSAKGRGGSGGGTSGGAKAGGSAPTLSAPTSHAALGSTGGLLSPRNTFSQQQKLQQQADDARFALQQAEHDFRGAEAEKTREWNEEQSAEERAWREVEAAREREWRAGEAASERDWRTGEALAERDWKAQQVVDAERRALRDGDYERQGFSGAQIARLRDLDAKIASIQADKTLTEDQRGKALYEVTKEKFGMKPLYSAKPDPNDPSAAIREVSLSDGRKVLLMQDARGQWTEFVPNADAQSAKNDVARIRDRANWIQKRAKDIADAYNSNPNNADVLSEQAALEQATREYDQLAGSGTPPPPSPGGGGGASKGPLHDKYRVS